MATRSISPVRHTAGAVALALLLAACGGGDASTSVGTSSSVEDTTTTEEATSTTEDGETSTTNDERASTTSTTAKVSEPTFATSTIRTSQDDPPASVDVEYPVFAGGPDERETASLSGRIESYVQRGIEDFYEVVNDFGNDEGGVFEGVESEYELRYQVLLTSGAYVTIQFDLYQHVAGAAHPFTDIDILMFDLSNGDPVDIIDLIDGGDASVEPLIDLIVDAVTEKFEIDEDEVFRPDADSLPGLGLTPLGLAVGAGRSELLAGVYGSFDLVLPWNDLDDLIDADAEAVARAGTSHRNDN